MRFIVKVTLNQIHFMHCTRIILIKVESITFVVNSVDTKDKFTSMKDFWDVPEDCYVKENNQAPGVTVFIKTKKGVATLCI